MSQSDLITVRLPALALAKKAILMIGVALTIMVAVLSTQVQWADAATAEHLGILRVGSDEFYNYDYTSEENNAENVDWAIDMLFYNDSSVNKVKKDLGTWFYPSGSTAYAYFVTPKEWQWDGDKGKKESSCTFIGDNVHYRIYGPKGTDRFYNLKWGFYNIASTHIDHNECNVVDKWSGASEKAEGIVASDSRRAFGRRHVKEDAINFHNPEKHYNEGSHHWEGNGYATIVWVR